MTDAEATSAKRITYVIDGDGKILAAYPKVATATHAEEILSSLSTR